MSVRPSVRPFVRIIIDFYEEDMKGAETLLDTGSLNYEFWRFCKKLKKDLQKLGLTNGIWWFRDPDLDPVLTMVWVIFFKTWFFESRWYQGIESSRNQWIRSDVIWRVRIVGSELFDSPLEWIGERDRYGSNFEEVTLRAPALQGVSSIPFAKINYYPNARTHARTWPNLTLSDVKSASRKKNCHPAKFKFDDRWP